MADPVIGTALQEMAERLQEQRNLLLTAEPSPRLDLAQVEWERRLRVWALEMLNEVARG
jgi:hypothetical protein